MLIKATIIKVLFAEIYVNVVFVIRCLYRIVLYKNYLLSLLLLCKATEHSESA